jgi:hypothetical protein
VFLVQQLAELVGKNLNQLAGLGGLTFQHYKAFVLPGITEQIVHCEDKLAQRSLMEVRPVLFLLPHPGRSYPVGTVTFFFCRFIRSVHVYTNRISSNAILQYELAAFKSVVVPLLGCRSAASLLALSQHNNQASMSM